jgi:hypothetical protein
VGDTAGEQRGCARGVANAVTRPRTYPTPARLPVEFYNPSLYDLPIQIDGFDFTLLSLKRTVLFLNGSERITISKKHLELLTISRPLQEVVDALAEYTGRPLFK